MSNTRDEIVSCALCDKEIPQSAALTSEGADYTWHFCGTACYVKWQSEQKT